MRHRNVDESRNPQWLECADYYERSELTFFGARGHIVSMHTQLCGSTSHAFVRLEICTRQSPANILRVCTHNPAVYWLVKLDLAIRYR